MHGTLPVTQAMTLGGWRGLPHMMLGLAARQPDNKPMLQHRTHPPLAHTG